MSAVLAYVGDWIAIVRQKFEMPQPGDVFFYRSKKLHARAIELAQSSFVSSDSDLVHAAIMISHRVLIESNTESGVHYVDISESAETYSRFLPSVILRHAAFRDIEQAFLLLLERSFFYERQKYDWRGAFTHRLLGDQASICSSLVARILEDTGLVGSVLPEDSSTQVYPAELYNKLLSLGFEEVQAYSEPTPYFFESASDKNAMLTSMSILARISDSTLDLFFVEAAASTSEIWVSCLDLDNPLVIIRQLYARAVLAKSTVLETQAECLLEMIRTVELYRRITATKPLQWQSISKLEKNSLRAAKGAKRHLRARLLEFEGLCLIIALLNKSVLSNDENESISAEDTSFALFLMSVLSGETAAGKFAEKTLDLSKAITTVCECKIEVVCPELEQKFLRLGQLCVDKLGTTLQRLTKIGRLNTDQFTLAHDEAEKAFSTFHGAVTARIEEP